MKLVSKIAAATVIVLLASCKDKEDSTTASETDTTDYENGTSNISSLALDEILTTDVPDELGSDTSLLLTASGSKEQCQLRRVTAKTLDEMNRVGAQICLLKSIAEIEIPAVGDDGNIYKVTFKKDPDASVTLEGKRPPRSVFLNISQPEEGTVRFDICDPKGPKQLVTIKTDGTIRTGELQFSGTDPRGITRNTLMKFAINLTDNHLKLDSFEHLINTNNDDEVRRFVHMDLPQDPDNTTVPHIVNFSSVGTWRGGIYENMFASSKLLQGFGEALFGEIPENGDDDDAVFRRARFKTSGTAATEDQLPDKEEMAVELEDVPAEVAEADLPAEPTITACDAKKFTEITITTAQIEAATECASEERTEANCTGRQDGSTETGLNAANRPKPAEREAPAVK